ncbi:MAG: hypothetical protein P8103_14690 [Candidatus Thiodiazotropha sp.]
MDIQQLLDLRKITQAVSRKFEDELKTHLATLAPLFSPLALLGEYARGGSKTAGLQSERSYRELCTRFKTLTEQKPFLLNASLKAPLDLFAATPVLIPVEYDYSAGTGEARHQIKVTRPLNWTLSYPEATPKRIKELLAGDLGQVKEELVHAILQALALAVLYDHRPGLARLFQDLRFPLQVCQFDGLGSLPVLSVKAPLETHLPEDEVIIQNTQLTGIPSFEEVLDNADIQQLVDPMRQDLIAIAQSLSPDSSTTDAEHLS